MSEFVIFYVRYKVHRFLEMVNKYIVVYVWLV